MACGEPRQRMTKVCAFLFVVSAGRDNGNIAHNLIQQTNENKIVIFYFFAICNLAKAQIKVEKSFNNELIIIGNLSAGRAVNVMGSTSYGPVAEHKLYCRLFNDKVTYGILISTPNHVDDDFEFALGTDVFKAKESVGILLNFMKESDIGKSLTITDEDGRTIQIDLIKRNRIKLKIMDSERNEVILEDVSLLRVNLERALYLLENKAHDKVIKKIIKNQKK